MLYYILPLVISVGILLYAYRQKFEPLTTLLILTALALYYFHFYHAHWDEFAIDITSHAEYVEYLAKHCALPPIHLNSATRHPPLFYVFAAAFYKLGEWEHMQEPLMMARHAAMICFICFICISINILRLLLRVPGPGYYAALVLLLFWPIGATMGARITCDVLFYAAEAGVLYWLTRWALEKQIDAIGNAFIWSGMAISAKTSGIIVLLMTVGVLLVSLLQQPREFKQILHSKLPGAVLFCAICYLINFLHEQGVWTPANVLTEPLSLSQTIPFTFNAFYHFNLFLFLFDTAMGLSRDSFWNMLLHSLMLGNGAMIWKANYIPIIFNFLWLIIITYFAHALMLYGRNVMPEKEAFILLGLFCMLMTLSMAVMLLRTHNVEYSDARYIYPVVIVIALCHGKAVTCHQRAGHIRLYHLGVAVAVGFLLLTPTLFIAQYLGK